MILFFLKKKKKKKDIIERSVIIKYGTVPGTLPGINIILPGRTGTPVRTVEPVVLLGG